MDPKKWPPLLDVDDLSSRRRLQRIYRPATLDQLCYLDFAISSNGTLSGIKVRRRRYAVV